MDFHTLALKTNGAKGLKTQQGTKKIGWGRENLEPNFRQIFKGPKRGRTFVGFYFS
jgi:hypothetical protein